MLLHLVAFTPTINEPRFLIAEQNQGVLGRDILNLLSLVFDGPNLFWEERKFFSN